MSLPVASLELGPSPLSEPADSEAGSISNSAEPLRRNSRSVENYPALDAETMKKIKIAAVYLKDAEKGRQINKNLEINDDEDQYFDQDARIKGYQFAVNRIWAKFVYIMIWIHLLMFNWEPVPPHPLTAAWEGPPRSPALIALELFILIVYSIDFALLFFTHDPENWCHPRRGSRIIWSDVCCRNWRKIGRAQILIFLIAINTIDLIIAATTGLVIMRFSVILRPGFLIIRARWIRNALFSMMKSITQLAALALFLALPLFAFSFVAYAMFSPSSPTIFTFGVSPGNASLCTPPRVMCPANQVKGNTFFATYRKGLESLIVLTTSSNFPDVMMQSYHAKPITSVFFLFFAYMANFFVMPVIFATVYYQFTKNEKSYAERMQTRIKQAQNAAFDLISTLTEVMYRDSDFDDEKEQDAERQTSDDKPEVEQPGRRLFYNFFRALMSALVPRIKPPQVRILYNAALEIKRRGVGEHNNDSNVVTPGNASLGELGRGLDRTQFRKIIDHARTIVVIPNALRLDRSFQSKVVYLYQQPRVKFRVLLLTVANVVSIVIQLFNTHIAWRIVADIFLYSFALEKVLLVAAYGVSMPTVEWFDTGIVWGSVLIKATTFFLELNESFFMVFRIFVVFFIMTTVPLFDVLFKISLSVVKFSGGLFVVEFIVFYVFSVIGMFLFSNAVSRSAALAHVAAGNDAAYWTNILSILYYDNNFNSLWRSMVTLAELTVVNNWMVIYGMYVKSIGSAAILFFYVFYIIAVLFAMNAIMSLIVDVFLRLYAQEETNEAQIDWGKRIKNVLKFEFGRENMQNAGVKKGDFVLLRRVSKSELYRGLYLGDETKDEENYEENSYSDDESDSDRPGSPDVVVSSIQQLSDFVVSARNDGQNELEENLLDNGQDRDE